MKTSLDGIKFLERHEGVVLKAYRDPVGIWTIGAGLTKASGVVTPNAGMKLSKAEAVDLLHQALSRNYEPAVRRVMPGAKQHEFDGGVSFHWNTGGINRANWVKSWKIMNWQGVRIGLMNWTKGEGRVLPGLVRRRHEEFSLIRSAHYSKASNHKTSSHLARVIVAQTWESLCHLRKALVALGYDPGVDERGIKKTAILQFQRDHDLTADGVIGRATLSTVQRMLDVRSKSKKPAAGGVVAVAETQTDLSSEVLPDFILMDWLGWIGLAASLCWLAWLAFSYRDALAVKAQSRLPKLAKFLRSF